MDNCFAILEKLFFQLRDKPWDYKLLSNNKSVTMHMIEKTINKPWDFEKLSKNTNISLRFIEKFIDMPWDFYEISNHPELTMDFVNKYQHKKWNRPLLMQRFSFTKLNFIDFIDGSKYINLKDVENNPNEPWDWNYLLSKHPDLTGEFVVKFNDKPWNFYQIAKNQNIKPDFIESQLIPRNIVDWKSFSTNKNITTEFLEKHIDKPWNWCAVAYNNHITLDFIDKHFERDWDWIYIFNHFEITDEFIEKNLVNKNNQELFNYLSKNKFLTVKTVQKFKHCKWDWHYLLLKTDMYKWIIDEQIRILIDESILKVNEDKIINVYIQWLCKYNPYITYEFLEKHMDMININNICYNNFIISDHVLQKRMDAKRRERVELIREELMNVSWHPDRFMLWCLDEDELKSIKQQFVNFD